MKILNSTHFITQPWKNGGGTTTELLKISHPDHPNEFLFRLSRADLTKNGTFSIFPQIDRYLMILEGKGVLLNSKPLRKSEGMIQFSGEEEIFCELIDGPVTDFNIMVNRTWAKIEITIADKGLHNGPCFIFQINENELYVLEQNDEYFIRSNSIIMKVNKLTSME